MISTNLINLDFRRVSCSLQTAEDLDNDKVERSGAAYPPIGNNFKESIQVGSERGPPGAATKDPAPAFVSLFRAEEAKSESNFLSKQVPLQNGKNNESACLLHNLVKTLQTSILRSSGSLSFLSFSVCISKRTRFWRSASGRLQNTIPRCLSNSFAQPLLTSELCMRDSILSKAEQWRLVFLFIFL